MRLVVHLAPIGDRK